MRERFEEAEWRGIIERLLNSGLSTDEFARREGLKPHRVRWWRGRLALELARDAQSKTAPAEHGNETTSEQPSFVRLVVHDSAAARDVEVASSALEVVLFGSGHRIRVLPNFDELTFTRLVMLLRGVS